MITFDNKSKGCGFGGKVY